MPVKEILLDNYLQRLELKDKINVIEPNRVIARKIIFPLSLQKNLQVSKL